MFKYVVYLHHRNKQIEIMKSAMNQLEKWILDYEKVNGSPTMCEIKSQLEMFKEVEK